MKKKVIASILAIMLMTTMIPLTVFAAGETIKLSVSSVEIELEEGATIELPILATENTGYASGTIDLTWDSENLVLENIDYNTALSPAFNPAPISNEGSYRINFGDENAAENYVGTGTFFTLIFKVATGAKADKYDITISNADVMDAEIETVDVELSSGSITLIGKDIHTHDDPMEEIKYKPASCTEDGNNTYYYCSGCDKYYKDAEGETETSVEAEIIPKTAHSFVENPTEENLKSAATCTSKAVYYKSCENCGEKSDETFEHGDKADHEYGEIWKYNENKHWHECIHCGDKHDEADHYFTKGENGSDVCEICGYKKNHVHTLRYVEGVPATCTSAGTKGYYICDGTDGCGRRFEDQTHIIEITDEKQLVIDKLPHTSSDWIVDKEATQEEKGSKHKECTVCHTLLETQDIEWVEPSSDPTTEPADSTDPSDSTEPSDATNPSDSTEPSEPYTVIPSQDVTDATSYTGSPSTNDSPSTTTSSGSSSGSSSSSGTSGSSSSGAVQTGETGFAALALMVLLAALSAVYATYSFKKKS